jgi:hypothetical protein
MAGGVSFRTTPRTTKRVRKRTRMRPSSLRRTRRKRMRVRATMMMTMRMITHRPALRARRSSVRRACHGTRWRDRLRRRIARLPPGGWVRRHPLR